MPNTIHFIKKERAWQNKYDASAPKPGDMAPDFELSDINGQNPIRLSSFRHRKPVLWSSAASPDRLMSAGP